MAHKHTCPACGVTQITHVPYDSVEPTTMTIAQFSVGEKQEVRDCLYKLGLAADKEMQTTQHPPTRREVFYANLIGTLGDALEMENRTDEAKELAILILYTLAYAKAHQLAVPEEVVTVGETLCNILKES